MWNKNQVPARKIDLREFIYREQAIRGWPKEDWLYKSAEELAELFETSAELWENLKKYDHRS